MAQQGFLVVTFDPIGCGTRIDEIRNFYQRYPNWSLMGKMTQDISLAIDAIRQVPLADTKKIHIVGYDTGALIALYAAALDSGITSVTAIGALHPMRAPAPKLPSPFDTQPDTPQPSPKTTLDRWYLNPLLLPKFATFQGYEQRVPYDLSELMALIAPRPLLHISFTQDLSTPMETQREALDATASVYKLLNAKNKLFLETWNDYNRLTPELIKKITQHIQNLPQK